jgi:hypothetical protein
MKRAAMHPLLEEVAQVALLEQPLLPISPACETGPAYCQVLIRGRLHRRSWTDHEGVQRWTTEIMADRVLFLGSRDKRTSATIEQVEPPPPDDAAARGEEDIPFYANFAVVGSSSCRSETDPP